MALARWRPRSDFLGIQDEINRLFDEFFGPSSIRGELGESTWVPRVDISETANELIVNAELPGITKDDVKVTVQDNVLTFSGEKKQEKETNVKNYHRIERNYGSFSRSFTLPTAVDATKVKATFKDGVLSIVLPKIEVAKTKQIPIEIG